MGETSLQPNEETLQLIPGVTIKQYFVFKLVKGGNAPTSLSHTLNLNMMKNPNSIKSYTI